jgi:hypothetical protein
MKLVENWLESVSNLDSKKLKKSPKVRAIQLNNTSGVTGVYLFSPTKKWRVMIGVKTKMIYLGYFVDKFDAICARKRAELKYM